jgi:hypothetical protein
MESFVAYQVLSSRLVSSATARPPLLLARAGRDAARLGASRISGGERGIATDALDKAIGWLCRSHDATGRLGSSKGFSLVRGWLSAYPETTGYVLEVLLWHARHGGADQHLAQRAREMGDWELGIQEPDGGIMQGQIGTRPRRSIVFNTGQVLHGWITLLEAGHAGYEDGAARAARFLTDRMNRDGTWDAAVEYSGLPHTYNARAAWAMLRYARLTGASDVHEAGRRQLDWTVAQQQPNGWFHRCAFKPGMSPNTHGIAYTLRGLLEAHEMTGEHAWLRAVEQTSEVLIRKLELLPRLAADYDDEWRPVGSHSCLTGTAQLGGVWLRLYAVTRDARWLNAGLKAVEQAAGLQERDGSPEVRGALAGSFPIWGRYAPLQYPNWATRFLAESLMLYRDATLKGLS